MGGASHTSGTGSQDPEGTPARLGYNSPPGEGCPTEGSLHDPEGTSGRPGFTNEDTQHYPEVFVRILTGELI